jgi:hypothetical protein
VLAKPHGAAIVGITQNLISAGSRRPVGVIENHNYMPALLPIHTAFPAAVLTIAA